jgi:16S rRNA (cytidine1402-2'-O)-methyltransferase
VGKLYICGTPIGNLEDVSIRLLKTLRRVDYIACEDTRQTLKLLNHYKIKSRLVSYHEHSDKHKEDFLLQELQAGKDMALVSDAGMPAISDPGQQLIKRAWEEGIEMEVIPGPSALTAAVAASGVDCSTFVFAGFLPNRSPKRKQYLAALINEQRPVICYEAPHRLLSALEDIEAELGSEREIVVARELTKVHQEIVRGQVDQIREKFSLTAPRGEICLIIAGKTETDQAKDLEAIMAEVEDLIEKGLTKKEAFKMKASEYHLQKSTIYNYYVEKHK